MSELFIGVDVGFGNTKTSHKVLLESGEKGQNETYLLINGKLML